MNTTFRTVFFTLVSITLLSGGTSVYLASQPSPNQQQITVQTTCLDTWKLCVGAIAGLVGGRNLPPSNNNNNDDNDNDNPIPE